MRDYGLKEMTKKGIRVREDILERVIKDMALRRTKEKRISLVGSLLSKVKDGYVHPDWNENGSGTGRITSSNPCLSNLPKEGREAIVAEKGKMFIMGDWKQYQIRIMGYMSGCRALTEAKDIYQEIADKVGCSRKQAKLAMISIQFGAGNALIRQQTGVDNFREMYEEAYPEVALLKRVIMERARDAGEVRLVNGAILQIEVPKDKKSYEFCKAMNKAVAMCIQGSAAVIFKNMLTKLVKEGFDVRMCLYDGVVIQEEDVIRGVELKMKRVKRFMEEVEKERGWHFPVEMSVGRCWK